MLWSILLFPFPILIRTKKKRREHPSRCKKSQWITCNNKEIATRNPKCKKQHKQRQPICWCLMQTVRNTTIATTETISYAKQTKAMCSAQATHSSKQHILLCHVVECNTHQTTPPSNTIFITKDEAHASFAKQNNALRLQCVSLLQHEIAVKMK